jgi:hypothetical protein
MSYIILRGRWCHIIVLKVHVSREDKIDDEKKIFYWKWNPHSTDSLNTLTKILLADLNAEVAREDIIKPTIGNERLHEISNGNGIKLVNFATTSQKIW